MKNLKKIDMKDWSQPYLITFQKLGKSDIGYIGVAEVERNIPFSIERVFWTYYTPESISRGRHAHHETEQVLIAVAGSIVVDLENRRGDKLNFVLDSPSIGLYLPPDWWHTMQYSHTAVQLVLASKIYDEADYIRDYEEFNPS